MRIANLVSFSSSLEKSIQPFILQKLTARRNALSYISWVYSVRPLPISHTPKRLIMEESRLETSFINIWISSAYRRNLFNAVLYVRLVFLDSLGKWNSLKK